MGTTGSSWVTGFTHPPGDSHTCSSWWVTEKLLSFAKSQLLPSSRGPSITYLMRALHTMAWGNLHQTLGTGPWPWPALNALYLLSPSMPVQQLQNSTYSKTAPGSLESTVAPSGKCFHREPRGDIKTNWLTSQSTAWGEFGAQVPGSGVIHVVYDAGVKTHGDAHKLWSLKHLAGLKPHKMEEMDLCLCLWRQRNFEERPPERGPSVQILVSKQILCCQLVRGFHEERWYKIPNIQNDNV